MLAAKNSRKRIEARSPAAVTSAGIWPCGVVTGTRLQFMLMAPAKRCEITVRAVPHGVSA
jgi:hypothetical protein